MYEKILFHVEKRELLFFWDRSYNMFGMLKETQLKSLEEQLKGVRRNLTNNPDVLVELICMNC